MSQITPRVLSASENELARWLIEGSTILRPDEKTYFLAELAQARVTSKCDCGCASIEFEIGEKNRPHGDLRPISEAIVGANQFGVFVYEQEGVLSGMEIYGMASMDLPSVFPPIDDIRIT
jgi:hypothetical protein